MLKIVRYVILLAILSGLGALPVQAQDGTRVEQGVAFLTANAVPSSAYAELATALTTNDYRNVAAVLVSYGYSPEQLKAFLSEMNLLLLRSAISPAPSDAILIQALTLLQSYGLNALDLQMLAPMTNDPAALITSLTQKGLTSEQAQQLLQQAAPLFQEMADQGLLPYYTVNGLLFTFINDAGLPLAMLYDSAYLLDDPAAAAAYLASIGFSGEQVQAFVDLIPQLVEKGVTPDVIEGWTIRSLIYRLEGIGLPPQSLEEVVALGSLDVVRGYLIAQGLSGDVLELALVHIGGCMGSRGEMLNPARLRAFQAREARILLDSAGVAPKDLAIILTLRSNPAAMQTYLTETYGLDQGQIDAFTAGLSQSTFARTVDPTHADDFIASVQAASAATGPAAAGEQPGGSDVLRQIDAAMPTLADVALPLPPFSLNEGASGVWTLEQYQAVFQSQGIAEVADAIQWAGTDYHLSGLVAREWNRGSGCGDTPFYVLGISVFVFGSEAGAQAYLADEALQRALLSAVLYPSLDVKASSESLTVRGTLSADQGPCGAMTTYMQAVPAGRFVLAATLIAPSSAPEADLWSVLDTVNQIAAQKLAQAGIR